MKNKLILYNKNYSKNLCCPINNKLIVNPVYLDDGYTYDEENIKNWLKDKKISPVTNNPVKGILNPNFIMNKIISEWKEINFYEKEFYFKKKLLKYKENNDYINENDIILINPNFKYYGSIINGLRNGKGKLIWSNNQYYGDWVNGKRNGFGIMNYSDGSKYEGEWINNRKIGKGTYTWNNKNYYKGNFKNDKCNGEGTLFILQNGKVIKEYKGNWCDNKIYEGEIKSFFKNNTFHYITNGVYDLYKGQIKNFNKQGYGTMKYYNNSIYEGEWFNDLKQGKGNIIYENGITYNGEWYKGYKKGYGEEVMKKNDKVVYWYAGEWKNNNKDGYGEQQHHFNLWKCHKGKFKDGYPDGD